VEILSTLQQAITLSSSSPESVLSITYRPQSVFRVQSVSRCVGSLPGHSEPILSASFDSSGLKLATGSGDSSVRIWDPLTSTPIHTLSGHSGWVLAVVFNADGSILVSGDMSGEVLVWSTSSGKMLCKLKGHRKWITSLAFEPYILNPGQTRLASGSKDFDIRVWDLHRRVCVCVLSGHMNAIKALKWGHSGLLYSASADRTVKVWAVENDRGKLVRTLDGHGHWVNCLSINTEAALRLGAYNHRGQRPSTDEERLEEAKKKINEVLKLSLGQELLVSGSDDFTLFLWKPTCDKKPIIRMSGHQQPINHLMFSPDGSLIASASFDKSIRLWNGTTGKFICAFRGHVQAVYQCCWSADSRLLCSASKDSTIKVWDVKKKIMSTELPGHADEVFAVDWSPDGSRVVSGGKDRMLKLWAK